MAESAPVTFTLLYSADGVDFTNTRDFVVQIYRAYPQVEMVIEHPLAAGVASGTILELRQTLATRYHLTLTLDADLFDETRDETFASWLWVFAFLAAPYKRVSTNDATVWGLTQWNATDNTENMVLDGDPPTADDAKGLYEKEITIKLKTAVAYL